MAPSLAALAALTALAPPSWALDPEKDLSRCAVEVWGPRDGLTGSIIRDIDQTPDGYLWFANYAGVARYDGAKIIHLPLEPPVDVTGIEPGPDGELIVGPRTGDPKCARLGRMEPCSDKIPPLPKPNRLFALHSNQRGALLLGTDNEVLLYREGKQELRVPTRGAPFERISTVMLDGRGRPWVGTTNGLFAPKNGKLSMKVLGGKTDASAVWGLFETASGRIWILRDNTLLRLEGQEVETHALPAALVPGWTSKVIEDRDGNVWLGTEQGLTRFRDGAFLTFSRKDGLPGEDVTALFEDREGSLWVGTRTGALAQFTDRTVTTSGGPPSLEHVSIESVCEDGEGALWLGTWRGLTRWKDGEERLFTEADGLPATRTYAAHPGAEGELWIGTAGGLARMRGGVIDVPVEVEGTVFSLYLDRKGSLWIGTNTALARLEGEKLTYFPTEPGTATGQVRGMQEDDRGVLWVTSVGGLHYLEDGRLKAQREAPGGAIMRADRGISKDAHGHLWFGSGTSLVRLRGGKLRAFTAEDGLPRDWLFQTIADDLGHLWIGTSRRILRVTMESLEAVDAGKAERLDVLSYETSDRRDEIAARRSRTPGVWKGADGRLWFATLRGVVHIDPKKVRTNRHPPTVVIERALVDGRAAQPGAPNDFPPGPGNLEFQFAGLTLLEPHKASHRYRLDGFDKEWVDAGTRRVAYYTNIAPGEYTFRVQASNADGLRNTTGASLALTLAPHYYQTTWFFLLCGLAVAGAVFGFYRMRLARLRGQYLAVFAERSRLARELHDSLLQGMSAVALEVENVRAELPGGSGVAGRLEAVEDALNQGLQETRRFVWNLREQPAEAGGDLGLALERLVGRLAEGHTAKCTVAIEGATRHLPHDAQGALFRVAQEALSNALRHAAPTQVDVRLLFRAEAVVLSVTDDGCGFDPATAKGASDGHFGLLGMRERAARLSGECRISSEPGKGTVVELTIPSSGKRGSHV